MICFSDRTFCASPECNNECRAKMTPEIKTEAMKSKLPIAWAMFCGEGDYPDYKDIERALENE